MYFILFYVGTVTPLCVPCDGEQSVTPLCFPHDIDSLKKGGPLSCTIAHILDVCFLVAVRRWSEILLLSLVFPANWKLGRKFWLHSDLGQEFFLEGAVYLVLHHIRRHDWKFTPPSKVLSDQSVLRGVTSRTLISPVICGGILLHHANIIFLNNFNLMVLASSDDPCLDWLFHFPKIWNVLSVKANFSVTGGFQEGVVQLSVGRYVGEEVDL